MNQRKKLSQQIAAMQYQLNHLLNTEDPLSDQVLQLSKELDKLIVTFQKTDNKNDKE
ncbi:MAG: Spo0E like sporulation regulatory protein [Clostridiales bacterium]|jgi:hypothetical protein|nr:Spo0E like sporulation regulatory protein [Clostridiales bacterium]MDK2934652.1 Spo0E like sporulation regulatory protein [Clostridiales bacterium]